MNQEEIGKYIATLRKKKKITQEQLGQIIGVSGKSVSKWERGINLPDYSNFYLLAEYFNISINELFEGKTINNVKENNQVSRNVFNYFNRRNRHFYLNIIFFLFILFTGVLMLFFINNYNKDQVYIINGNNQFVVNGYYVLNNKQQMFFINNINDQIGDYLNSTLYQNVSIYMISNDNYFYSEIIEFTPGKTVNEILNNISILYDERINKKIDINNIVLRIELYNDEINKEIIEIPISLINLFKNNKLIY